MGIDVIGYQNQQFKTRRLRLTRVYLFDSTRMWPAQANTRNIVMLSSWAREHLKEKGAPERLLFANVLSLAAAALLLHPTRNIEPAMTTEVISLVQFRSNRARVPHPNYAHVYYTRWSVQSSSFPHGVTPSDFWSHSLLSTIMRHQHPSSKASSFECITY